MLDTNYGLWRQRHFHVGFVQGDHRPFCWGGALTLIKFLNVPLGEVFLDKLKGFAVEQIRLFNTWAFFFSPGHPMANKMRLGAQLKHLKCALRQIDVELNPSIACQIVD